MKKKELPKLQFNKRVIANLSEKEMKAVPGGGDSVLYATTGCITYFTVPKITNGCGSDFTKPGTTIIIRP